MKFSRFLANASEYQVLILRIGLGFTMFFGWGLGKLLAGPERWAGLGEAMAVYGITFAPVFWGFMATFAESIAALGIALGLFTRFNAFLLGFTMLTIIVARHTQDLINLQFNEFGAVIYILLICIVLMISGAGSKLNLEKQIFGKEWL